MRSPTLAAGILLLAVPMLTVSMSTRPVAAAKAKAKKSTIGSARFASTHIDASNGSVQIVSVTIKANGNTINSVSMRTSLSSAKSALTASAGTTVYHGSITIPNNAAKGKRTVKVFVDADTSAGVVSKQVGSVTQNGGATSGGGGGGSTPGVDTPPPPPPI